MSRIGPLLALASIRKRRIGPIAIVDGTVMPTAITGWRRRLPRLWDRAGTGGAPGDGRPGWHGNPAVITP